MSKTYLFAVMLLAASLTGCIEGGDLEKSTTTDEEEVEETEEEDTLDPVGADDNAGQPTSLMTMDLLTLFTSMTTTETASYLLETSFWSTALVTQLVDQHPTTGD